jgi:hypothetical protein
MCQMMLNGYRRIMNWLNADVDTLYAKIIDLNDF